MRYNIGNNGLVCINDRRKKAPQGKSGAYFAGWRWLIPFYYLYGKGIFGNGRKEKHYDLCGFKKAGGRVTGFKG